MVKTKFCVGDKIRYLGTKDGKTGGSWRSYFGSYGIKKGSKGIIQSSGEGYIYVHEDGRPDHNGFLIDKDLMLEADYIKKFEIKLTKKQRQNKINKIIKEIKSNKEFLNQFKGLDLKKEINEWSDIKVNNW